MLVIVTPSLLAAFGANGDAQPCLANAPLSQRMHMRRGTKLPPTMPPIQPPPQLPPSSEGGADGGADGGDGGGSDGDTSSTTWQTALDALLPRK